MRFRKTTWLDTKTSKPVYGIKAEYKGKFYNAMSEGKPLFFDKKEERDQKIKDLKEIYGEI